MFFFFLLQGIAKDIILIDWCLTPTLAVFQLYRGGIILTITKMLHILSMQH